MKFKLYSALGMLAILFFLTSPWWSHGEADVVVTGTMVKAYGTGEDHVSKYLIFTSNGVFENTDTWWYFKFNSSDVQAKLMVPGKHHITYYGFRVPFLSRYQNIVSAQ
jgi:hypothetical protein